MSELAGNSLNGEDQLHPIGQHLRLEWNKAHRHKRTRITTVDGQKRLFRQLESKMTHPLYQNELCYWPFCETSCGSFHIFLRHLITSHLLDDKSRAECNLQNQIVEELLQQLIREKQRLRSMIKHLQQIEALQTSNTAENETEKRKDDLCGPDECSTTAEPSTSSAGFCNFLVPSSTETKINPVHENGPFVLITVKPEPMDHSTSLNFDQFDQSIKFHVPKIKENTQLLIAENSYKDMRKEGCSTIADDAASSMEHLPMLDLYSRDQISTKGTLRNRCKYIGYSGQKVKSTIARVVCISLEADNDVAEMLKKKKNEKKAQKDSAVEDGARFLYHGYKLKANTSTTMEMAEGETFLDFRRHRQLYKTVKKRPPFSFPALIRQAILESPASRLTLKEIYDWFENNFAYFREIGIKHSMAQWKNSIRHTLSLSKCFIRSEVGSYNRENPSYWMVNDTLFNVRHPCARLRPTTGPSYIAKNILGGDAKKSKLSCSKLSVEDTVAQLTASNLHAATAEVQNEHLLRTQSEPVLDVFVKEEPEEEEEEPFYGFAEDEIGVSPSEVASPDSDSSGTPDTNSIHFPINKKARKTLLLMKTSN